MFFENPSNGDASRESRLAVWFRRALTGAAAILVLLVSVAIAVSVCLWINYNWNVPPGWWYLSFVVSVLFSSLLALGMILRRVVRQRWRFGTRTLLFAFTLVAIVAALLANRIHFDWRKQSAVWELTQQGGYPNSISRRTSNWISNRLGYDPFLTIDFVDLRRDGALAVLADHPDSFPSLTDITFRGASDAAMRRAGELDKLKQLRGAAVVAGRVSDAGMADLAAWRTLERLCFNEYTQITDAGLAHFENHPNLELLFVISEGKGKLPITDAGLASIGKLPKLKTLILGESSITDTGLRHLEPLCELEVLVLQKVGITDDGLTHLARLPRLKKLSIRDTKITDAGIAYLSRIGTLESVHIYGMNLTDGVLENLRQLTNLKSLWIRNTDVRPEIIKALRSALPDCEVKTDEE